MNQQQQRNYKAWLESLKALRNNCKVTSSKKTRVGKTPRKTPPKFTTVTTPLEEVATFFSPASFERRDVYELLGINYTSSWE
ncbi:hypothetical protein THII_2251 [Thioploca ingrica]|uniref:Uncharacterized protein n=1 Tax=Thioploca ingrica TaxID=40754 RepID=A0A090AEU2_9GAMM|nr:hypothetical protein THII_2251 [Thioploca ingrica]